jgi:diacylglycerol kinase (ATP)
VKIALVANTGARRTAEELARARAMLVDRGVHLSFTSVVESHKQMCRCLRGLVADGTDLVIVGGGDGTMTAAAGQLAKSGAVLGVLPLGTGNSFALSLGIATLERAVDAIVGARTVDIDLGTVNGTYFANFATIGLSSTIARATPSGLKRVLGAAAYVLAGLIPGLRSRPFRCRVRAGKARQEFQTYQVIVANGRYFGHQPLVPEASLDSGSFVLYAASERTKVDAAKTYASLLFAGEHLGPNTHLIEASELRVRARPKQQIAIDGEICGTTPARFELVPAALRVIVPADWKGTA